MTELSSLSTSSTFLARIRQRDGEAWRALVGVYGPRVYAWVRERGLNEHDAADVMQDVFRSVLVSIDRFRRDRPGDRFRDWLWTITRRRAIDHYRRRTGEPQARGGSEAAAFLHALPEALPPDPMDEASLASQLVRTTLDRLHCEFHERTWRAFEETALAGRPSDEVAAELGMTLGALYVARSRVLSRLRQELSGLV